MKTLPTTPAPGAHDPAAAYAVTTVLTHVVVMRFGTLARAIAAAESMAARTPCTLLVWEHRTDDTGRVLAHHVYTTGGRS
jgi:hypothetical protein